MEEDEIINKVANSSLITFNLEDYYHPGERVAYDIKDNLFQGIILKEKDFRDFIKIHDWNIYRGKNVAIICSVDAIVPTWAYMLLVSKMEPVANLVIVGDLNALEQALYQRALSNLNLTEFKDAKIVIKGCSKVPVPLFAYAEAMRILRPLASSIMYGEPCSTVPLYKKPKS